MDVSYDYGEIDASGTEPPFGSMLQHPVANGANFDFPSRPPELETRALQPAGATDTNSARLNDGMSAGEEAPAVPSDRENEKEEEIGLAARRAPAITAKEWAGNAVWARLAKYPWWPAQVLDENDPWIPNDSEAPRHGAIPVRFFGTYDFAWIESHRAICPYDKGHAEHSKQSRQKVFVQAMEEAEKFQETGDLPNGFNEDSPPSPQAPQAGSRKSRPPSGKTRGRRGQALGVKGAKRGPGDAAVPCQRSVKERQDSILRRLALQPPPDSPYCHKLNLDGVRKILQLKSSGLWPPQPPKPVVPALAQPQTFSGGNTNPQAQSGLAAVAPAASQAAQAAANHLAYPQSLVQMNGSLLASAQSQPQQFQHYAQLLQHQQLLQQLQGQTGTTPWFMQPSLYSFGYYPGQASGVQSVLMAAQQQQQQLAQKQLSQKSSESMRSDENGGEANLQGSMAAVNQGGSDAKLNQFLSTSRPLI